MIVRFIPESSGAVLDTATGLREWFNSYGEAISVAAVRNDRCSITDNKGK